MDKLSYEECTIFIPKIETAKCVKVYDGDTFHIGTIMPSPYGATRFCCRLLGVDTPELRSADNAEKALAREARDIVKSEILHKVISIRVSGHDKYGRLLVRIKTENGYDLSEKLIDEKVAVSYDGGKKKMVDWKHILEQHTHLRASVHSR